MRWVLGLFTVVAALVAIVVLARDLVPPKSMTLAAGGRDGGYWQIAERYRDSLARDGIAVTILETAGSGENALLLAKGGADVALLQGGVTAPDGTEALAAIFREPLFIFARAEAPVPANPGIWRDLTLAAGAPGSGTRIAVDQFLAVTGQAQDNRLLPLGGTAATEALLRGEADIALFVAPLSAPYLTPLFTDPSVTLLSLDNVRAIEGRLQHSVPVTLPAGAVSLNPLSPAADVALLAMTARLVAQPTLHPSLVDRLVEAAKVIHARRDPITRDGTFPTTQGVVMPVDVYAGDLLRNGTSSLQSFLPYWVVAQINRVAILLLPILFLLLPLFRLAPGLYGWQMRRRVFRHYQDITAIDHAVPEADSATLGRLSQQLDDIDQDLARLKLPLPYRDMAYTARLHLELLKRRINERRVDTDSDTPR